MASPEFEEWRVVDGIDGWYDVSSAGRVRSWWESGSRRPARRPEPLVLRPRYGRGGYARFTAYDNEGRPHYLTVHREACRAFHGEPPFGDAVVRHLDGDPRNNAVENLAWGTAAENCRDRDQHGRTSLGVRHPRAKMTEDDVRVIRRLRGAVGDMELAQMFDVTPQNIRSIAKRKTWAHVA